jgi:hypothetical protein
MTLLTFTGTGAQTRISPDPAVAAAGKKIPADRAQAGLAPGEIISPDPATAAGQTITVT